MHYAALPCAVRSRLVRVLLVDDHRMFTELLVQLLREHDDIDVCGIAPSVAEGLEVARRERPDLVLLDYQLPDGSGAQLAARLREDRPELRMVMLTGFQDEATVREAVEAGCSGFVTKDRAVEELVEAVRVVASGGAAISPVLLGRLLPSLQGAPATGTTALTARELDVLQLLAEGTANDDIGERLFISRNTVRNHVQRIITKLGAHSKLEAVATATRIGLVRPPQPG
jgi:DNA-binding NarL/FixJ family response regulator